MDRLYKKTDLRRTGVMKFVKKHQEDKLASCYHHVW